MAATDLIQEALTKFIASDQPGIFAVKGAWGVGKTYFWHKFAEEAKPAKNCRAYSYVSLFGIESVSELRRTIFSRQTALGSVNSTLAMATRKYSTAALRTFKLSAGGVENTDAWADIVEDKMNMAELSQAVEIMKEFDGLNPETDAVLVARVDAYVEKAGEDALAHLHHGSITPLVARMIRERVEAMEVKKTIPEVIELMSKPGGYDPAQMKYLKGYTAEEYYQFIKTTKKKEFLSSLKTFHERIGGEDPAKTVRERFEQALERLARESKINARRVRYGVGFKIPGVTPE